VNKLRILADLRECQEGFSGIAVDSCRIFKIFNQLDNVEQVGGLLLSQEKRSFRYKLSETIDKEDSYLKQAQYLNSLFSPELLSQRQKIIASIKELKTLASFNWFFKKQFSINPIDKKYYFDFIWTVLFSRTMPIQDYQTFLNADFFGSNACYPLAKQRTSRLLLNPRLDTHNWDIFFTSTPMNLEVNKNTKKVVRYHDAIPVFYPHLTPNSPLDQYRQLKACVREKNTYFVCNSANTRKELITLFPQAETRTQIIPCSVSNDFFKSKEIPNFEEIITNNICLDSLSGSSVDSDEQIEKTIQEFSGKYIICVSTIDPRKNYSALVRAWAEVRTNISPELNLVIVGRNGWQAKESLRLMRPYVRDGSLVHLIGVSFQSLRTLLSNAQAYVFPTLAEGFGIPPIEAMRCGCPTIVSSIDVMKETCGNASIFFNPYDTKDLISAIASLTETSEAAEKRREELTKKGYEHSEQFTVESCQEKWHTYLNDLTAEKE
jgi:glycosyltransferase involved in cell wall biosynthesis